MTIRTLDADLLRMEAERYSRSLYAFVCSAWHVVEPVTPFVPNWHLEVICEHLEAVFNGEIESLIINVPPGTSKSLMGGVFFPTWGWSRNAAIRWLFASYDQTLATRDSMKCRAILESRWYRERWPNVRLRHGQDEKKFFETTQRGYRMATSAPRGHATGEHPDIRGIDDPHNPQQTASETERQSVKDWHDLTWSSRGASRKARDILTMQRLHEDDLTGHILAQKNPGTVHICLPMRYEPGRSMVSTYTGATIDPRTEDGELLSPAQFPEEVVAKLEAKLGEYGAAGQLQQRPSPATGGIFKEEWWRFWTELPEPFDEIVMSWDMTFKKTGKSWVVGQVWGRKGPNCYLLDQVRGKWDFVETIKQFVSFCDKWPQASAKYVEDKANGSAVMSTLADTIDGLIPVEPEGGKESRASAVSPYVQAGNVLIPQKAAAPWVSGFIHEARSFPNGETDDQVDCMSQVLLRMKNRIVVAVTVKRPDLERASPTFQTRDSDGPLFGPRGEGTGVRREDRDGTTEKAPPLLGARKCVDCGRVTRRGERCTPCEDRRADSLLIDDPTIPPVEMPLYDLRRALDAEKGYK